MLSREVAKLCRLCNQVRTHNLRSDTGKPRSACWRCEAQASKAWRQRCWQRRKLRDTWKGMIARCHDPGAMARWANAPQVPRWTEYGAAGIKVCARWRDSRTGFAAFVEDVGLPPTPQHTLDRIRGTRGYHPNNVRWATPAEQARNRKNAREVEAVAPDTGERLTLNLSEWSRRTGVERRTISSRLKRGWPADRAVAPYVLEGVPF